MLYFFRVKVLLLLFPILYLGVLKCCDEKSGNRLSWSLGTTATLMKTMGMDPSSDL